MKIGNVARINICVLGMNVSLCNNKSNFRGYILSRISKKCELRKNIYSAKISMFTVTHKEKCFSQVKSRYAASNIDKYGL